MCTIVYLPLFIMLVRTCELSQATEFEWLETFNTKPCFDDDIYDG